jgi:hypothetical protein
LAYQAYDADYKGRQVLAIRMLKERQSSSAFVEFVTTREAGPSRDAD